MLSKVDNDETLKDLALRMGGTVRLSNGEVFNSSGSRGVYKRPAEVRVEKPDPSNEILRAILELLQKQRAPQLVMPEIPAPMVTVGAPQVTVQPAPVVAPQPCSWKFTFERNESGTIRSITATPTL